ncbi:MAG: HupE/UreJ family protein [Pseudomonadota bacterium]|nr:hypothetical protein [Pseudomonadales bacterium]MDY6921192.1 HupE/UreJ family protein [Pseudomonadota bacterium]
MQLGTRTLLKVLTAVLLLQAAGSLWAHDTPIALLTLSERQQGLYNVEWTFSSALNLPPPTPVFPDHCQYDHPRLQCGETGLQGRLSLQQLGERYSAAVVQIHRLNAKSLTYTLTGANPAVSITPSGVLPWQQIMASYVPLGFEHIMLGVDHLLFVLGLMWLVGNTWMLIKTITAFTVAHSITLAAVTLGWVGVPEQPVNAAIALSIAIVAVEVLKARRGEPSLSARMPWVIAFGFGLLHGFGFAGALTDIGLPPENLPAALLFFNVGVELGQIGFVLAVLALLWSHRALQAQFPRWSETAAIYAVGTVGSFWFLSRLDLLMTI